MNCHQFEQYLNQYLDGELEGTLKLEFEAHLVDCSACGHEFAMMEAVGRIIASPSPSEPRIRMDFTDRVMSGLSSQRTVRVDWRRILNKTSLAAAVALVLTGTVIFSSARFGNSGASKPNTAQRAGVLTAASISDSRAPQDWLAGTFERAGMSLLDLKELKSSAFDQVREGIFSRFAGPSVKPVQFSASEKTIRPVRSVLENSTMPTPIPVDNASEAGLELL